MARKLKGRGARAPTRGLAQFGVTTTIIPPPEIVGGRYHEVADRIRDQRAAFEDVSGLMERIHMVGFSRMPEYQGRLRYHLTGRVERSLTMDNAYGALRDFDKGGLRFGTRIWYAHFLTKGPHDPAFGQLPKEPPGEGLSAVLFFPRGTKKQITEILLSHIMEPVEERPGVVKTPWGLRGPGGQWAPKH